MPRLEQTYLQIDASGQHPKPEFSLSRSVETLKYGRDDFRVSKMPRGRLFLLADMRRFVLDRMHQDWAASRGRLHFPG